MKTITADKCYICDNKNESLPSGWYSMWYDGKQRTICSMACRQDILRLCADHPEKTYSEMIVKKRG